MAAATAGQVSSVTSEIQVVANLILSTIETIDPAVAVPVEVARMLADLAAKAIAAFALASGTPVTVEAAEALLAGLDMTPLSPATPPDSGAPGVGPVDTV